MDLTNSFVGKEVRRILFSLKKASGEYYHIFSIYENIDEDMQDYRDFAPNHRNEYNDFVKTADGKEDKLYLTIDRVTMTELFYKTLGEPIFRKNENYIGSRRFFCGQQKIKMANNSF